jgi:hypothetical protein
VAGVTKRQRLDVGYHYNRYNVKHLKLSRDFLVRTVADTRYKDCLRSSWHVRKQFISLLIGKHQALLRYIMYIISEKVKIIGHAGH